VKDAISASSLAGLMSSRWRTNLGQRVLLLVILSGLLILLLANLGNQYLWQDEAQTALVSKTILTEGVPRGYDGKNLFSQEKGAEYGNNYIWRWHTWLPFYVLAGFYKVFGVSTFVSRLPFALFGFGTVFLTYFFARQLWPGTRVSIIAAALLAISVPFLLLCRQCRYYSMAMFFSMLSLYAYVALVNGKKYSAVMLFVALTLLFHTQHFYIAVLLAALLLHAVLFHRNHLKILLAVIVAFVLVNGPWLVWLAGVNSPQLSARGLLNLSAMVEFIRMFLADIIRYMFPLWLLAVVLIAAFTRYVRTRRLLDQDQRLWEKVLLPVFFVIFNIAIMAIISPAPFFRYIAPSVPLLIILIAVIIDAVADAHWLLAVATAALLVATSQLKDYFYEITHDYDGPGEGIVRYLNEYGSPGDIVAITYGDMPLKFYTNMRVIGGLTGEDLEPAQNARWVIIRKYFVSSEDVRVKERLLKNIEWDRYRKIVLNYPDILWENREGPGNHLFRTRKNEDRVIIHERIK
jgi:4-amino-4-deoxy-L-arabinose transferase-like glycosyltransferase